MKLQSLKDVERLADKRQEASKLLQAVMSSPYSKITIVAEGYQVSVGDVLSGDTLRSCLILAVRDELDAIDAKLSVLGVSTADRPKEQPTSKEDELARYRMAFEEWNRAWQRELGDHRVPKSHLIDDLVLSTRTLREKAEALPGMIAAVERLLNAKLPDSEWGDIYMAAQDAKKIGDRS